MKKGEREREREREESTCSRVCIGEGGGGKRG